MPLRKAPVTVLIYERGDGVHLSYDRLAGFPAPCGNLAALAVARDLDAKAESLLSAAAEGKPRTSSATPVQRTGSRMQRSAGPAIPANRSFTPFAKKGLSMTLGLSISAFTRLHVFISLVAIASGVGVLFGFLTRRPFPILTAFFLITTVLTSVTGFMFPFKEVTPGIVLGILSMFVLLLAIIARYVRHMEGPWRGTFVISSCIALYFNVFVLFAQLFAKVPELHAIAPTQSSPAFALTQGIILILFVAVTFRANRRFHLE